LQNTSPANPPRPRRRWLRNTLITLATTVFVILATGVVGAYYLAHKFSGRKSWNPWTATGDLLNMGRTALNPKDAFPRQNRINILCLGLDRNWTRKNMPYTKDARTDTMMVASLDLDTQRVSILSIPRDTRVELPRGGVEKINAAHSLGGIPYTKETVEQFLGIKIDYHVVIKQEAIEGAINALGGVKMKVEKDMDYDDNWGHLHIHLKKGVQTLNGEQVVGYMRFRKDEEGDLGRIRRQQQVVRVLTGEMKNPHVVTKVGGLFDQINKYVKTDLSKQQIVALGRMFHQTDLDNVVTASLPCYARMIDGISFLEPEDDKKELVVDWLLRGNEQSANKLISVAVVNGCKDRELTSRVVATLRSLGFRAYYRGRLAEDGGRSVTLAQDHGRLARSARRVVNALGVAGAEVEKDPEPDRSGPYVTLVVGGDLSTNPYILTAEAASDFQYASAPVVTDAPRRTYRRRRRRSRAALLPASAPRRSEAPVEAGDGSGSEGEGSGGGSEPGGSGGGDSGGSGGSSSPSAPSDPEGLFEPSAS